MSTPVNAKIKDIRTSLDLAFKQNKIKERNTIIEDSLDHFEEIEKKEVEADILNKISRLKVSYCRELLSNLNIADGNIVDLRTFMILLRLKKEVEMNCKRNPNLQSNYDEFINHMNTTPFAAAVPFLKKKYLTEN